MAIEIKKTDTNAASGHITIYFVIVDGEHRSTLIMEGIDYQSLTERYNCPHGASEADVAAAITRWLADRHPVLLAQQRAIRQRSGVVAKLAGQTLKFAGEN